MARNSRVAREALSAAQVKHISNIAWQNARTRMYMQAPEPVVPASKCNNGMGCTRAATGRRRASISAHGGDARMQLYHVCRKCWQRKRAEQQMVEVTASMSRLHRALGPRELRFLTSFPISAEVSEQFPFIQSFTLIEPLHYQECLARTAM